MTTLTVTTNKDYQVPPNSNLVMGQNIDHITFAGPATASFSATQFGGANISNAVVITGSDGTNRIRVFGAEFSPLSAADWTLVNWTGSDRLVFMGSNTEPTTTLFGSSFADEFHGGGGHDVFGGGGGNDIFLGDSDELESGDWIDGGDGIDRLELGTGFGDFHLAGLYLASLEVLDVNGRRVLLSGLQLGPAGFTTIEGTDDASDRLIVSGVADLSHLTFVNWTDGEDFIEIRGGAGVDFLFGSSVRDQIFGENNGDALAGFGGADFLRGDAGDDHLFGGDGADELVGGLGFDFIWYSGSSAGVTIRLDTLAASGGEAEGDIIDGATSPGSGIEGVVGSGFADILYGNAELLNQMYGLDGDDQLHGLAGVDYLFGDAGADELQGEADFDYLVGGDGADELNGGHWFDLLFGGAGADSFISAVADLSAEGFTSIFDYIYDFEDGLDSIVLSGWSAASLFMYESGGAVFITSADHDYLSGVVVFNATLAQVQDQVIIA